MAARISALHSLELSDTHCIPRQKMESLRAGRLFFYGQMSWAGDIYSHDSSRISGLRGEIRKDICRVFTFV